MASEPPIPTLLATACAARVLAVRENERVAAFTVPVSIRLVAGTLSRNATGKTLKPELSVPFADRTGAGA